MPKVSLIIPVYNVSKYLERCVETIARQTFNDFEAIFVNDGSTDNSAELCQQLISPYPYMRMVCKENGGLTSARVFGLHESIGEYICFIDSDDYLHPEYLKSLYDCINEASADISICAYYTDNGVEQIAHPLYFNSKKQVIDKSDILEEYVLPQIASVSANDSILPAFIWLRLFRREVLTPEVFVSEREVMLEDLALSLKIFGNLDKIAIVNTPLYYYCITPGSLTLKYRENVWTMLYKLYSLINTSLAEESNGVNSRKDGFLLNAVNYSLRLNTAKGYKTFAQTAGSITSNEDVKSIFCSVDLCDLSLVYRIIVLFYRLRMFKMLYFLYKIKES